MSVHTAWPIDDVLSLAGIPHGELRFILERFESLDAYLSAYPWDLVDKVHRTPAPRQLPEDMWAIAWDSPAYPHQLRSANDPPAVIFGLGDPDALEVGLAVIGSRDLSAMGEASVQVAIQAATALKVPVHSGMARGVDALAHRLAIDAGLRTVAVLASSCESPTPSENRGMYEDILSHGGAVISEHLPGQRVAEPWSLVRRNRIICGLASVVIPCQAELKARSGNPSGTMQAVGDAMRAGRSVVVPRPKRTRRPTPGTEGLLALCTSRDGSLVGLREAEKTLLRGRENLADAVAESRDDLRELVILAHRMSPQT